MSQQDSIDHYTVVNPDNVLTCMPICDYSRSLLNNEVRTIIMSQSKTYMSFCLYQWKQCLKIRNGVSLNINHNDLWYK